jgi:hypothetical protein
MTEYILLSTTERYLTVTDNPDLEKIAEYQYFFFGKRKTTFAICKVTNPDTRISIEGVSEVFPVNSIPVRIFPKFSSIEEVEKEIYELDINEESKVVKSS